MENGTSPAPNNTQIMNGGIGLDGLVKTSPPIEKAVVVDIMMLITMSAFLVSKQHMMYIVLKHLVPCRAL